MMENAVPQVESFVGYENVLHDAIKVAQRQANIWLAQNKLSIEMISVAAQTLAEVTPGQNQMFYVHVITIVYPRAAR
jgi:hypothetical protein